MRSRAVTNVVALLVGCVIALGGLLLFDRIRHNHSAQLDTCRQVQQLSAVISGVLSQDLRTLGQRGTGGYAYYRSHPDELASTRMALRHELAQFAPKHCH